MANASKALMPYGHNIPAPGKSGDVFATAEERKNVTLGLRYISEDGLSLYRLVKAGNASAPADGDLCRPKQSTTIPNQDVDDVAAGDNGEGPAWVYVSAPAQNKFCFVIDEGLAECNVDGGTDDVAAGDMLVLDGTNNALQQYKIATPTATSASKEVVAIAQEANAGVAAKKWVALTP